MKQNETVSQPIRIKAVVKALAASLVITFVLFMIFAFILFLSRMNEAQISGGVFVISVISLILGGMIASKQAQKAGFLHGAIVAVCYLAVIFIGSVIMNKGFFFNMRMVTMTIGCLAAGIFGGIIGVNIQPVKKFKRS
ncbi:MAG: TIGR04086 family membrane protein [Oscillospiraceae bacterium]|nr:TIGR04086 family membrane protein [Oscillospiraceae bacterium]